MSSSSQYNEIRLRLESRWGNTSPISWPNRTFTPPNPKSKWIRLIVKDNADAKQVDIGSDRPTVKNSGVIYVSIFDKPNTGTEGVSSLADLAAEIFGNWCGPSVKCGPASVRDIGLDPHDWYMFQVVIPFTRSELI
jgi:hypothetical protein